MKYTYLGNFDKRNKLHVSMHKDNMLVQFFKRSLQNDGKERAVMIGFLDGIGNNEKTIWIPTNHRLVKFKFYKYLLNGIHEAEPDTWIFHLFYN